jgi:hypothetical protein
VLCCTLTKCTLNVSDKGKPLHFMTSDQLWLGLFNLKREAISYAIDSYDQFFVPFW